MNAPLPQPEDVQRTTLILDHPRGLQCNRCATRVALPFIDNLYADQSISVCSSHSSYIHTLLRQAHISKATIFILAGALCATPQLPTHQHALPRC